MFGQCPIVKQHLVTSDYVRQSLQVGDERKRQIWTLGDCCHRGRTEDSGEQRCETGALQRGKAGYLSKFSPGLFFLHSSMCNQVVEDFSCKRHRERE